MSKVELTAVEKLRAFVVDVQKDEVAALVLEAEPDVIELSLAEVKEILNEIDWLRSVAGPISKGESFTELRKKAGY